MRRFVNTFPRLALRRHSGSVAPSFAVALDIDGVVVRGPNLIPGSKEAIRKLKSAGVNHIFMTNGGGVTEATKAAQLAALLEDDTIDESKVLLAHTPMRSLAERFKFKRVVIVGSKEYIRVARAYGFDFDGGMAVTPSQILAGTPGIYDNVFRKEDDLPPVNINADSIPIEAIIVLYHPLDWAAELQVLSDVLCGGRPLGSRAVERDDSCDFTQRVEVFTSNPDFVYASDYAAPRYATGAFVECLRSLWRTYSGGDELRITEFGKPHAIQYRAAEQLLIDRAAAQSSSAQAAVQRFYMIGDNPLADVRGANNAGPAWRSILVCTGVYNGGATSNDLTDPAWKVEPDLLSAVHRLLEMWRLRDDHT